MVSNDGKAENYVLTKEDQGKTLRAIGVDNDLSFCDPIVKEHGRFYGNVRSIFFLLPLAHRPVDVNLRRQLLALEPTLVILEWLRTLHRQNLRYEGTWSSEEQEDLHLPLRLRSGCVLDVFRKLQFCPFFFFFRFLAIF